ncbi:hypothetical protein Tco_0071273 [Tanacetum coccineum]
MHVNHLSPHVSHHLESLSSVPDAYCQSLEALLSQPAASGSESHVPGAVSGEEYYITVVVSDEHGAETRVHIPAHGGSKAQNGLSDSILSHESKPLRRHRPPLPHYVWSPNELSYPP